MSKNNNMALPTFDELLPNSRRTVSEPKVPFSIKSSPFFVHTVGMREVPERMLLELFREVAFKSFHAEADAKDLEPDDSLTLNEQALLHIGRGRSKKNKNASISRKSFYGPLYPVLARNGWHRGASERIIKFQLFEGPIAQYLLDSGRSASEYATNVVKALNGRSRGEEGDLFRQMVDEIEFDTAEHLFLDQNEATQHLAGMLSQDRADRLDLPKSFHDPLSNRIARDFNNLCTLEGTIPRILWIELLKSFLRIAMPSWLLAQMRITVLLRDWALSALAGKDMDDAVNRCAIANRGSSLFHPTQTGSNEVLLHVESYVKARVELSVVHYLLCHRNPQLEKMTLAIDLVDKHHISIANWLAQCRDAGRAYDFPNRTQEAEVVLLEYVQNFKGWLKPSKVGQGKNIIEFLRVFLRLSPSEADDGYLLTAQKAGSGFGGAVVFPGPAILKMMLHLAALEKITQSKRLRGKLVLADLENHFGEYGVDFASSGGARPKLISELSRLALLRGSPDAGDSAELIIPDYINSESIGNER